MWNGCLGRQNRPTDVNRQQRVKILDCEIGNIIVSSYRGIVDENVEAAQSPDRLVHGVLYCGRIGAVSLDRDGRAPAA